MPDPRHRQQRPQRTQPGSQIVDSVFPSIAALTQNSGTSRRLINQARLARVAQESANDKDLTSDEMLEYRRRYGDSYLRDYLGLPDHIDIQSVSDNPRTLRWLNSGADERARALRQLVPPPGANIPQIYVPTPTRVTLTNHQRAMQELARQGYGGDAIAIPTPRPDTEPALPQSQVEAIVTPEQQREDQSAIDSGPSLARDFKQFNLKGLGMRGVRHMLTNLDQYFEPLDVFAQTGAELSTQIPKLYHGKLGELEAPTLVTEGFDASLEVFRDRPLMEQLALSVLDPTIIFGGWKFALKTLLGATGKIAPELVGRELAQLQARNLARQNATTMPVLPEFRNFLRRIRPSKLRKVLPGPLARWADPSPNVLKGAPDSPGRILKETAYGYHNAREAGDAFVEVIMANLRTKFDLHDLFGTADGFAPEAALATKVTHKAPTSTLDDITARFTKLSHPDEVDFARFRKEIQSALSKSTPSIRQQVTHHLSKIQNLMDDIGRRVDVDDLNAQDLVDDALDRVQAGERLSDVSKRADDIAEAAEVRGLDTFDADIDVLRGFIDDETSAIIKLLRPSEPAQTTIARIRGEAPYFGNVMENRHLFDLTPKQAEALEFLHKNLDDALAYWKLEGVNVEELGSAIDSFWFFPRRVTDELTGKKVWQLDSIPGRPKVGKHRTQEFQNASVLAKGKRYEGPYEALNAYFRAGYAEVAKVRAKTHAGPLFKSQAIDEALLNRKKVIEYTNRVQERSIRDVGNMLRGFVPTGVTIVAMKRGFPTLASQIDTVTQFRPQDLAELVQQVGQQTIDATKLTAAQIKDIISGRSKRVADAEGAIDQEVFDLQAELVQIQDELGRGRQGFAPGSVVEDPGMQGPFAFLNDGGEFTGAMERLGQKEDSITRKIDELLAERAGTRVGRVFTQAEFDARELAERAGTKFLDPVDEAVEALMKAGVRQEAAAKLVAEASAQSFKVAKEFQEQAIRALRNRMQEIRPSMIKQVEEVQKDVKFARSEARGTGQTKGVSDFFTNSIVKDFFDANGNQIARGEDIAKELDRLLIDAGQGKAVRTLVGINATLRFAKTAVDFGAPLLQGLPLLMRDPVLWGQLFVKHIEAWGNPAVRTRYISLNSHDIIEMIQHGGLLGSSEFTEAMADNGFFARLPMMVEDVPLIGQTPVGRAAGAGARLTYRTVNRFASSFETFLDLARVETWKALRPVAKTNRDLDEIASFVNKFTGTTSSRALGVPQSQQQLEALIPFFSPRYTRATAGLMADMLHGGMRGDLARVSMARLLFGAAAVHVAAAKALGQPINLDPTKPSEFMRVELFGQRVGFGGKALSNLKNLVKISVQTIANPKGFLSWNIFSPQDYIDNKALAGARNQMSAGAGTALSLITGTDPLGKKMPGISEPVEMIKTILREPFPFWLDAAIEAGGLEGFGVAAASEGAGLVAFSIPKFDIRDRLFEKYAQQDYNKSYEELLGSEFRGRGMKQQLLVNHPDLLAAAQVADAELKGRTLTQDRITVKERREEAHAKWIEDGNRIGQSFARDILGGDPFAYRTFNRDFSSIGKTKREATEATKKEFPEVFADLDLFYTEIGVDLSKEGNYTIVAQNEFFDRLFSDEIVDPTTGRTDYAALDRLRADMDALFGPGMMDKIDKEQRRSSLATEMHPFMAAKIESFTTLRPYWEAYKEVLEPEDWDDWLFFDGEPAGNQDKLLLSRNLTFRRMQQVVERERRLVKRESREIDEALFVFHGFSPDFREVTR